MHEININTIATAISVIVVFVGLIAWFVRLENAVKNNKDEIAEVKKKQSENNQLLVKIAGDVAVIKNDIGWIRTEHNRIQEEYREIKLKLEKK